MLQLLSIEASIKFRRSCFRVLVLHIDIHRSCLLRGYRLYTRLDNALCGVHISASCRVKQSQQDVAKMILFRPMQSNHSYHSAGVQINASFTAQLGLDY